MAFGGWIRCEAEIPYFQKRTEMNSTSFERFAVLLALAACFTCLNACSDEYSAEAISARSWMGKPENHWRVSTWLSTGNWKADSKEAHHWAL
jgi:hypothetical protein